MSGKLNGIVKLSQIQYEQLMKNKTITVNGVTVNYDQNTLYIVEAIKVTVEDNQEITGNKNFTGDIKKKNVDVATINDIPPVVDVLTSDSSTSSLSAKQGKVLDEKIQNMMSTLNGKNASFTFDTLDTLLNHFPGISKGDEPADKYLINTDKITYGGQEYTLKNGDIFLIVDINVPDYWFSIDDKTLYKLETAKVDLAEYAKITDLTMYAKTSDLAEYAKTSDVSKDYLKKEDIADWAKQANPPSNVVLVDNVYQEIDGMKVFLKGVESGNGVSTAASGFKDARRCADDNNNTHQLSLYVGSEGTARLAHKNRSVNTNNIDSYIAFDSTKLKYGTSGNAGTAANNEYDIITSDYMPYKYAEEQYLENKNIHPIKDSTIVDEAHNSVTVSYSNATHKLHVYKTDTLSPEVTVSLTKGIRYQGQWSVSESLNGENSILLKTGTYTVCFDLTNKQGTIVPYVYLGDLGGNLSDGTATRTSFSGHYTFTVDKDTRFMLVCYIYLNGITADYYIPKIQLEKGDKETSFAQFNAKQHITNKEAELLKNEWEKSANLLNEKKYLGQYCTYADGKWTSPTAGAYNFSIFTKQVGMEGDRDITKLPFLKAGTYTVIMYNVENNTSHDDIAFAQINSSGKYVKQLEVFDMDNLVNGCVIDYFTVTEDFYLDIRTEGNSGTLTFTGIAIYEGALTQVIPHYEYNSSSHITNEQADLLESEYIIQKNMLDINQTWESGGSSGYVQDNKLYVRTIGGNGGYVIGETKYNVNAGEKYAISGTSQISTGRAIIRAYDSSNNLLSSGITKTQSYNTSYQGFWNDFPCLFEISSSNVAYIKIGFVALDTEDTTVGQYYYYEKIQFEKGENATPYVEYKGPIVHKKDLAKVATTGNYWDLSNLPTIPTAPTDYISYEKTQSLTNTQKDRAADNMGIDRRWSVWWTNTNSSSLSGNAAFAAQDINLSWSMTAGQAYEIKILYKVNPATEDNGYGSYQEQSFIFFGGGAICRGKFNGVTQDELTSSAFSFCQRELVKDSAANKLRFTSCRRFGFASSTVFQEANWHCVPAYILGREIDYI